MAEIDREKIIKGMELLHERLLDAAKRDAIAMLDASMVANAIVLLKKQEEETMFVYDSHALPMCKKCGFHPFEGYIPKIEWMKERGYMNCPSCGRSVKWDA